MIWILDILYGIRDLIYSTVSFLIPLLYFLQSTNSSVMQRIVYVETHQSHHLSLLYFLLQVNNVWLISRPSVYFISNLRVL